MLQKFILLAAAMMLCIPGIANEDQPVATTTEWVVANSHNKVAPATAQRIVDAAVSTGSRHGVDPILILAVMRKESGYREKVFSSEGASCLMQIIPRWHREKIRGRVLTELSTCVDVGTLILKEYLGLCRQDIKCALTKYSGGDRRYAGTVLAWRARIVMETGDAPALLTTLASQ